MRVALLLFAMAGTADADVCSIDEIATRIERLTGRVVDATTFAVSAEQRGNTIVATVEVGGGTREVTAPSCDAALDAAALVIGMAAPEPPAPAAEPLTRDVPASIETPQQPGSPPLVPLAPPPHARWAMSLGAALDSTEIHHVQPLYLKNSAMWFRTNASACVANSDVPVTL